MNWWPVQDGAGTTDQPLMKNLFDLLNKSPLGQFVVAIIVITSAVIIGFKTLFAQTSESLPFNGPLWLNALAIFGLIGTILLIIGFAMPEMTRRKRHTGAKVAGQVYPSRNEVPKIGTDAVRMYLCSTSTLIA